MPDTQRAVNGGSSSSSSKQLPLPASEKERAAAALAKYQDVVLQSNASGTSPGDDEEEDEEEGVSGEEEAAAGGEEGELEEEGSEEEEEYSEEEEEYEDEDVSYEARRKDQEARHETAADDSPRAKLLNHLEFVARELRKQRKYDTDRVYRYKDRLAQYEDVLLSLSEGKLASDFASTYCIPKSGKDSKTSKVVAVAAGVEAEKELLKIIREEVYKNPKNKHLQGGLITAAGGFLGGKKQMDDFVKVVSDAIRSCYKPEAKKEEDVVGSLQEVADIITARMSVAIQGKKWYCLIGYGAGVSAGGANYVAVDLTRYNGPNVVLVEGEGRPVDPAASA